MASPHGDVMSEWFVWHDELRKWRWLVRGCVDVLTLLFHCTIVVSWECVVVWVRLAVHCAGTMLCCYKSMEWKDCFSSLYWPSAQSTVRIMLMKWFQCAWAFFWHIKGIRAKRENVLKRSEWEVITVHRVWRNGAYSVVLEKNWKELCLRLHLLRFFPLKKYEIFKFPISSLETKPFLGTIITIAAVALSHEAKCIFYFVEPFRLS